MIIWIYDEENFAAELKKWPRVREQKETFWKQLVIFQAIYYLLFMALTWIPDEITLHFEIIFTA